MDAASSVDATLKVQAARTKGLEVVACNLCGSDDAKELYASNVDGHSARSGPLCGTDSALGLHGRIVRCRSCGLTYISPRERASDILDAYEMVEDPTYLQEEQGRIDTFRNSLKLLHRLKRPPGSLLDVGCYAGLFLALAQEEGWDVMGVEPSRWACQVARQRCRVEVRQGSLSDSGAFAQPFDVVTMWDVLEHYTDPMGELKKARQLLRPRGILALTTIDIGSLIAKLLGRHWWWLMEMHLYYFTRQTVTAFLERSGFEVLAIHRHVRIISLRYLWSRLEPRMGGLARGLSRFGERAGVNTVRVPVALGDVMTVVARKHS